MGKTQVPPVLCPAKRVVAPRLFFLIGLPGSGKSFLARKLVQVSPERSLISTDAIRAQLFGDEAIQGSWRLIQQEIQIQLRQALRQIQEADCTEAAAIYDATNTRRKNRREAIAQIRAIGFRQIAGIWLDTPLSLCLERNRQRDRQVPEAVILRMARQLKGAPPSLSDGLDGLQRSIAKSR